MCFPWVKWQDKIFFGYNNNVASGDRVASKVALLTKPKEDKVYLIVQYNKRKLNGNLLGR